MIAIAPGRGQSNRVVSPGDGDSQKLAQVARGAS